MRPRRALPYIVALVLVGISAVFLIALMRHTIRLSAADIQSQLETKFPQEKRKLIFVARFSDPTVAIDPGTGLVTLGVSVTASALGVNAMKTHAETVGAVRYESSTGELFLDSPITKVDGFEMIGLSSRDRKTASELIEKALQEYLTVKPLYRLKSSDTKLFTARRVLKSIRVRDGEIELELGF